MGSCHFRDESMPQSPTVAGATAAGAANARRFIGPSRPCQGEPDSSATRRRPTNDQHVGRGCLREGFHRFGAAVSSSSAFGLATCKVAQRSRLRTKSKFHFGFRHAGCARFLASFFSQRAKRNQKRWKGSAGCRGFRKRRSHSVLGSCPGEPDSSATRRRPTDAQHVGRGCVRDVIWSPWAKPRAKSLRGTKPIPQFRRHRSCHRHRLFSWHPQSLNGGRNPVRRPMRCRKPQCQPPASGKPFWVLFRRL